MKFLFFFNLKERDRKNRIVIIDYALFINVLLESKSPTLSVEYIRFD